MLVNKIWIMLSQNICVELYTGYGLFSKNVLFSKRTFRIWYLFCTCKHASVNRACRRSYKIQILWISMFGSHSSSYYKCVCLLYINSLVLIVRPKDDTHSDLSSDANDFQSQNIFSKLLKKTVEVWHKRHYFFWDHPISFLFQFPCFLENWLKFCFNSIFLDWYPFQVNIGPKTFNCNKNVITIILTEFPLVQIIGLVAGRQIMQVSQ